MEINKGQHRSGRHYSHYRGRILRQWMFIVFYSCMTPSNGNILVLHFRHNILAIIADGRWSHQCVRKRGIGKLMPTKWGIKMILWVVINLKLYLSTVSNSLHHCPRYFHCRTTWRRIRNFTVMGLFMIHCFWWNRGTAPPVPSPLHLAQLLTSSRPWRPAGRSSGVSCRGTEDKRETESEAEAKRERYARRMWNLSAAAQLPAWMLLLQHP